MACNTEEEQEHISVTCPKSWAHKVYCAVLIHQLCRESVANSWSRWTFRLSLDLHTDPLKSLLYRSQYKKHRDNRDPPQRQCLNTTFKIFNHKYNDLCSNWWPNGLLSCSKRQIYSLFNNTNYKGIPFKSDGDKMLLIHRSKRHRLQSHKRQMNRLCREKIIKTICSDTVIAVIGILTGTFYIDRSF